MVDGEVLVEESDKFLFELRDGLKSCISEVRKMSLLSETSGEHGEKLIELRAFQNID
jgi:hypothetical protein